MINGRSTYHVSRSARQLNRDKKLKPCFLTDMTENAAAAAAAAYFLHTAFRKPKRIRTAFTPTQLLKLESAFEGNQYLVGQERKDLAKSLSLSETQVSARVDTLM